MKAMEADATVTSLLTTTSKAPYSAPPEATATVIHASQYHHIQRQRLFALFQQTMLTDVELVVQNDIIPAHRVVLAAASPFFNALFTSGMKESHAKRVQLHETNAAAMRELLRYMYMGHLHVSGDNILALVVTANQLEMEEVVQICCNQLMMELSVYNCVDIFLCCDSLKMRTACHLLAAAAGSFLDAYLHDVMQTDAFLHLPASALEQIVSRPNIQTHCNLKEAMLAWYVQDVDARREDFMQIIQNFGIHQQVDVMEIHKNPSICKPTNVLTPTLFAIGGFNGPSALQSVEYLDFHAQQWFPAASMNHQRSYSGAVVLPSDSIHQSSRILVLGGASRGRHLPIVELFDPETNRWTMVPAMHRPRSYLGAVVLDEYVYVIGGYNGAEHLAVVERMDLRTNQWHQVASLHVERSGLAVATMHHKIYAIGGYDGRHHLHSVEVYDPATNQWTLLPSMRSARNGPAVIADPIKRQLIVFGGEARHGHRMDTSEVWDLKTNTWSDFDAFIDCRSGHAAIGFLENAFWFCVGGSNKKDEYLDTVHRYDPVSRQWCLHSQMLVQRCGLNLVVANVSKRAACLEHQRQQTKDQMIDDPVSQVFTFAPADFS